MDNELTERTHRISISKAIINGIADLVIFKN